MKRKIIFLFIVSLLVDGSGKTADNITTGDYCAFLNENQVTNHAFQATEQLLISGKPGSYRYEVAQTTDPMVPVTMLSWEEAAGYCDFKNVALGAPRYTLFSQHGAERNDHFLGSNLFTFCLVTREALAHEASGEGVALDGLFEAVEEATFGAMILSGANSRTVGSPNSFPHFNHERSERVLDGRDVSRSDTEAMQTATSLFKEPVYLKEKKETAQLLQQLIGAAQHQNNAARYVDYYKEADQYWEQDQQAWEERTAAQHALELKNAARLQAEKLFAIATEERSKTDTQKTLLARIARVTGKAAMPLSFIPGPIPLGGIAHTISEVTGRLNQAWVEKDVILAERAVMQTTQEVEQASKNANAANERAAIVRQKAKEAEEHARLLEMASRKDDRTRLHPPVISVQEADWKEWATCLVQAAQEDPSSIENLINHGMSDPLWIDSLVTKAFIQHTEKQDEFQKVQECLMPFETAFQEASQALQEIRNSVTPLAATAARARQRFEAATQIYEHWKSELEETNELLNELEKPENARKPESAKAITSHKEKFSTALASFEKAANDLQACKKAQKEAEVALVLEESKMLSLCNKVTLAEERLLRNRERVALYQQAEALQQPVLRVPGWSDAGTFTRETLSGAAKLEDTIFPPEILNKAYETIGKAFLKERRGGLLQEAKELPLPQKLLPEIREPSPEDLIRWEASKHAEDFIEERNEMIANIKRRTVLHTVKETETTPPALDTIHEEERSEEAESHHYSFARLLRSRKSQRTTENSCVSSMATQNGKSQSSLESFVSKNSIHSWSGSVAESIPSSVTSSATWSELEGLKKTTHAITEAANHWAELVRKADGERVAAGGIPYADEESLFQAWQESDQVAQAAWKKRCDIQERTLRTAAMAAHWEAHTARWEARAEADRLLHDQEEAEIDLVSLAEEQKPLDPYWLAQYQSASDHLKTVEKMATEAQKKWTQLAALEPSIQAIQNKEEKNLLLKKLRGRDQAINALWERVREDYYAEKEHEPRRKEQARLLQETSVYQFDLITEKIKRVATCFAKVDTGLSHGEKEEITSALEKEAIAKYAETTLQEALKAAWEQVPGAITAWEFRVSKAEKEYHLAEKKLENVITIARLAAITEADRKALEALQQETKEFADIEAAWRTALQEEEKAIFLKRLAAARAYHQGELEAWHALPYPERELYNEAIVAANETTIDMMQARLQEAWESTQEWHQKVTKAWKIFSKKSLEQLAQKAVVELTQLKTQEDQRRIAIRQAKIHEFECQAAKKERALYSKETEKGFLQRMIALRAAIAKQAVVEANAFCDELEITWIHKADVVQAGYNQAAYYAHSVQLAWNELAEAKRMELEKLPAGDQQLMTVAMELMRAEEEKEAWKKKNTKMERIALAVIDPLVSKIKGVFETVRSSWEVLRYYGNIEHAEHILSLAKLIKTQVMTLTDVHSHLAAQAQTELITMSDITEKLAHLIVAARDHHRVMKTALFSGSLALGTITLTGSTAMYILLENAASGLQLAPRTRKAVCSAIQTAQKNTEAVAHKTTASIWAADTAWCRGAIHEAQELVDAIIMHAAIR